MTVTLYVLSTPEFEPLVRVAEAAGMAARRIDDYLVLTTTESEVVLHREKSYMPNALWYAALTGGLDGRIISFSPQLLRLSE